MLTPLFELSQDDDFVMVRIRIPHLRADEGEFYIEGCSFKFYLKPYFLRLTFEQPLVEDGRERAEHDMSRGTLGVWLPKANAGEHFENLSMLTELLRKPAREPAGRPRIEVVGSEPAEGGDAEAEDSEAEEEEVDAEAEQSVALEELRGASSAYGFNRSYSAAFVGLDDADVLQLKDPENTAVADRRARRAASEDEAFSAEHYMADLMDDDAVRELLLYVPWWRRREASELREAACPAGDGGGGDAAGDADSTPCDGARLTRDEQLQLMALPRKEFLQSRAQRHRSLCGLLDLLLAYCYDQRVTEAHPPAPSPSPSQPPCLGVYTEPRRAAGRSNRRVRLDSTHPLLSPLLARRVRLRRRCRVRLRTPRAVLPSLQALGARDQSCR